MDELNNAFLVGLTSTPCVNLSTLEKKERGMERGQFAFSFLYYTGSCCGFVSLTLRWWQYVKQAADVSFRVTEHFNNGSRPVFRSSLFLLDTLFASFPFTHTLHRSFYMVQLGDYFSCSVPSYLSFPAQIDALWVDLWADGRPSLCPFWICVCLCVSFHLLSVPHRCAFFHRCLLFSSMLCVHPCWRY